MAFTDDVTQDEARIAIARKLIDSVAKGEGDFSDLEDEEGDLTHSILKKKALQASNKWTYKWADPLEKFLDDTEEEVILAFFVKNNFFSHLLDRGNFCVSSSNA